MIRQGSGRSSTLARRTPLAGTANFSHYVACKGGILSLTRALVGRRDSRHPSQLHCAWIDPERGEETPGNPEDPRAAVAARAIKRIGYRKIWRGHCCSGHSDSGFYHGPDQSLSTAGRHALKESAASEAPLTGR